jgi:hypothetical protein
MEGPVQRKRDGARNDGRPCRLQIRSYTEHRYRNGLIAMVRNLSLLTHLPRFEADGVMHRRDCECVRCDAGFRPSEQERVLARQRWEDRRERSNAERALARRRERARVKAAAVEIQLDQEAREVDDRIGALRAARARVATDRRLALLQALRSSGMPLSEALAEVDRRAQTDASVGPAGFEPATYGLKVRSSTS